MPFKMHQIHFRPGLRPRPTMGSSPDSIIGYDLRGKGWGRRYERLPRAPQTFAPPLLLCDSCCDYCLCSVVCEQQKQFDIPVDVVAFSRPHVHIRFRGRGSPDAAEQRRTEPELCSATAHQHVSKLLLQQLPCCS